MDECLNPYKDMVSDISPTEFEKFCFKILENYAEKEKLKEFKIVHNKKIATYDGEYQIDIYAEFEALGVKFKVLVECKHYNSSIEREKVAVLEDKLQRIGAQKGILISTSGFQSGAAKYAKMHGIALIQIMNKSIVHIQNSARISTRNEQEVRRIWYENLPEYYAFQYDEYGFPLEKLYPSQEYITKLSKSIIEEFKDKIN